MEATGPGPDRKEVRSCPTCGSPAQHIRSDEQGNGVSPCYCSIAQACYELACKENEKLWQLLHRCWVAVHTVAPEHPIQEELRDTFRSPDAMTPLSKRLAHQDVSDLNHL